MQPSTSGLQISDLELSNGLVSRREIVVNGFSGYSRQNGVSLQVHC